MEDVAFLEEKAEEDNAGHRAGGNKRRQANPSHIVDLNDIDKNNRKNKLDDQSPDVHQRDAFRGAPGLLRSDENRIDHRKAAGHHDDAEIVLPEFGGGSIDAAGNQNLL